MAIKYWIFSLFEHSTDLHQNQQGSIRIHDGVEYDQRLSVGDYVYLAPGWERVAGWGTVLSKEEVVDEKGIPKAYRVQIVRTRLNPNLIARETISAKAELASLFNSPTKNLQHLTVQQVIALNQLIGTPSPPNPSELDADSLYALRHRGIPRRPLRFVLNETLTVPEGGFYEFKEVKGNNPVGSIANTADEYAVSGLNGNGNITFWGVTNDRRILGVSLGYDDQDRIRQLVSQKLAGIEPKVSIEEFFLGFHSVQGAAADRFVVELDSPAGTPTDLYANASGDVWIQTPAGKMKLSFREMKNEILRRRGFSN